MLPGVIGLSYFKLISWLVTFLVNGLAVKRITAVTLVKGKRPPLPAAGGGAAGDPDGDELELDEPPVPT